MFSIRKLNTHLKILIQIVNNDLTANSSIPFSQYFFKNILSFIKNNYISEP